MFQAAKDVCFCIVLFDFRHFLKIVDYCINQNKYTPKNQTYIYVVFQAKKMQNIFKIFIFVKCLFCVS